MQTPFIEQLQVHKPLRNLDVSTVNQSLNDNLNLKSEATFTIHRPWRRCLKPYLIPLALFILAIILTPFFVTSDTVNVQATRSGGNLIVTVTYPTDYSIHPLGDWTKLDIDQPHDAWKQIADKPGFAQFVTTVYSYRRIKGKIILNFCEKDVCHSPQEIEFQVNAD